jgi:quinohemoprotein ethanol dehydrogenase
MKRLSAQCLGLLVLTCLATTQTVVAGSSVEHDWLSIHGSLANQRYVPSDQINRKSVARLGAAWTSEPFPEGVTSRMTPLVHAGLMFLAAGPRVIALDARTGKLKWIHQTESRKASGATAFEAMTSGLAIVRSLGLGLGGGLIFAGMMNGHVIALEESTGRLGQPEREATRH